MSIALLSDDVNDELSNLEMDKKLSLPDFLKLLTNNNVPVTEAMAVASKVFKEHSTPALLAQLDNAKLGVLGVKDRQLRSLILAAIRKAGYARSIQSITPGSSDLGAVVGLSSKLPSTVHTLITPKKKRKRDDDLNEFLPEAPLDEASMYGSMDFNEVLDEEILKAKTTVINRAPLMTVWATIVAERLGFDREEALSVGSVYTEMNAVSKGVSLGIIDQSRKKEIEPMSGGQQPYVDLMGRRPLYQTRLSKWRALVNGSPATPSTAFSYISRAFRQTTPHIVGALRLLAESYSPQELNKVGFSLYADFRPMVDGWGKRGEVRCDRILSLRKEGPASSEAQASLAADVRRDAHKPISSSERLPGDPTLKKARTFSIEESEAVSNNLELDE